MYIAFALTWRLCFNEMAAHLSFWWFFEVGIDLYFTIDVIMNFHTGTHEVHLIVHFALISCAFLTVNCRKRRSVL